MHLLKRPVKRKISGLEPEGAGGGGATSRSVVVSTRAAGPLCASPLDRLATLLLDCTTAAASAKKEPISFPKTFDSYSQYVHVLPNSYFELIHYLFVTLCLFIIRRGSK